MKITEQQLQTLRSLHCERLSCSEGNLRLIDQFFNSKGEGLVNTLQNEPIARMKTTSRPFIS